MLVFIIFVLATIVCLGGALGVVLARNPVHSALFLVSTLVSIAVFFVMQEAQLVAAVQIIVYASAIVVLFLFVIMLLGVDNAENHESFVTPGRIAGLVLGAGVFVMTLVLAGKEWASGQHSVTAALHSTTAVTTQLPGASGTTTLPSSSGNVEVVGRSLYTTYAWPFLLVAVLLVIAVVGAVVIAKRGGSVAGPFRTEADAELDAALEAAIEASGADEEESAT